MTPSVGEESVERDLAAIAEHGFVVIPELLGPTELAAMRASTIWAVDAFTADNGATEVAPGSHAWADEALERLLLAIDFAPRSTASPAARSAARERA